MSFTLSPSWKAPGFADFAGCGAMAESSLLLVNVHPFRRNQPKRCRIRRRISSSTMCLSYLGFISCVHIYLYKWMSSYMSNIICQIFYYLYIYVKIYFISSINVYIYYLSYCISWSTNQPVKPCLAFPRTHMTHMPRVLLRTRLSGGHGWVSSKTLPEILR